MRKFLLLLLAGALIFDGGFGVICQRYPNREWLD